MNTTPGFILVVDDNEMNRDVLQRRLDRLGYQVHTAVNGRDALDQMNKHRYDLVLLDIMMPEMNGYEVLEFMRDDLVLCHLPVLVVSAIYELDSIVKCISLGATDYLTKPFNNQLLQARIRAILEKKRLRDKEQAHLAEMALMQQIDRELNAKLDVTSTMEITLGYALHQTGDEAGLIGVIHDGMVHVVTSQGYNYELSVDAQLVLLDELPAALAALKSGQVESIENTGGAGRLAHTSSQLAAPINHDTDCVALLLLENTAERTWSDELQAFLTRLCNHAAIAIANAQLYEAVKTANQAKSEFVTTVTHELKIPMTSIRGYADLLISGNFGEINDAQQSFLSTIQRNIERMATLVSDLNDISRIETGHLHLKTEAVPLQEIVDDVLQCTDTQIKEKGQMLKVTMPNSLPPVWGDRVRLVQVLTNLVSNAHKYTPEAGQITICAETILESENGRKRQPMVHVSVTDTGLGIREEDQKGIFNKFYRADDEEARQEPGTGLGLNITKNLVELHEGRIWFESKYREGTTFHVVIPAAARESTV